ncbi:MAG TPA: ASKHA domain-containing protein [Anaerolineales bacterium]|nr:ASKHA domain-containing protein [Anaerolineales bacterium]
MSSHFVIFLPSGRRERFESGTTVLDAARQVGLGIESICGGKLTCGKCKVRVESGSFAKQAITSSPTHLSSPNEPESLLLTKLKAEDCRLACNAQIHGDLLITIPEESRAHKQIIRKSASQRAIDVEPAVRQYYVQVDNAELGEHRGDWGRLQSALHSQWQLDVTAIDLLALRRLQMALRQENWAVTATVWHGKEVLDVRAGYNEGLYGLAVDVGSTTVAAYLCDLRTGEVLNTQSTMNPQISFGEDLMSRVSYAMTNPGGTEKMHTAIIQALNKLAAEVTHPLGLRARDISDLVVVGNTTMTHLFLGIDPSELGGAPFALANRDSMDLKARELGLKLHPGAYVHVLPAEAGHVGADNVAVLLAEEPEKQAEHLLIVDIGTNAEIVLGNRNSLLSASSPTGPAFEGAQISAGMRAAVGAIERVRIDPLTGTARFRVIGEERWCDTWFADDYQPEHLASGICGSGIIEVVAELFLSGLLLPDGRFNGEHPAATERLRWEGRKGAYLLATAEQTTTGAPLFVTQDDIRNIQLAKAALYAGCKILMKRANLTQVDGIHLAGAFGSYIDPKYALILGLIPDCPLEKVQAVGNAAGDGARIALLDARKRVTAQTIAHSIHYVETAVASDFQDEFVGAIAIPHASDPFPNLANLIQLPTFQVATSERRTRMRIRGAN